MSRRELERLSKRIDAIAKRLRPRFPEMDPGDLLLIIEMILRPVGTGRILFMFPDGPNKYVF